MRQNALQATYDKTVRWPGVYLVGAMALLLSMEVMLFSLTVDDAYISFNYANHLAQGHGLVWHPGENPVEGYTNFLWVVWSAMVLYIGLDVVLFSKLAGVVLSLMAVVLMLPLARQLVPESDGIILALLLACNPALALWSVSGLETALFICLLLLSLVLFLNEEYKPKDKAEYWSVYSFFLLSLTRPEGAILFALLISLRVWFWRRLENERHLLRIYLRWLGPVVLASIVYFAWRWAYFGYPLPNTFYVKAQMGLGLMARQIGTYLIPYLLRQIPFVLLALYSLGQRQCLTRKESYLWVALILFAAINVMSSDWMPGHRLALPMTPLILLLGCWPLNALWQGLFVKVHWRQKVARWVLVAGLALYTAVPFLYTANLYNRLLATQMDMSLYRWAIEMQQIVDGQYVYIGRWLAQHALPDSTVVAANVGAIAYFSQLKVIDQLGLTDEHIARHGWQVNQLLVQNPTFIVLESDTPTQLGGLYGTGGNWWLSEPTFVQNYQLLFVLNNNGLDEPTLFIHHLPHATWLYARR